jgi:inorganic pyrophosphatase
MFQQTVIEIEKHSNQKYEYCHETGTMKLDRVLPYPYFYPYSYGFIPGTRAEDGDEMDTVVISDTNYKRGENLSCYIIGALEMEDEKGMDMKLLVLSKEDYEKNPAMRDIKDIKPEILEDIKWFFSNYKSKDSTRWSRIGNYLSRTEALYHYEQSMV